MKRLRISSILVLTATSYWCASCGSSTNSSTKAQASAPAAPTVEVTKVVSRKLSITTRLPGELQAYEAVAVFPKVTAYVDSISVDRGTRVKSGQLMARLVAPKLPHSELKRSPNFRPPRRSVLRRKPSSPPTRAPTNV